MGIVLVAAGIVATAVVLQIVAAVSSNLEIDDWNAAFKPGIAIAAVGYVVTFISGFVPDGTWDFVLWQFIAFLFVLNAVVLGLTSVMTSGIRFKGWGTFAVASVLVTVAGTAVPWSLSTLRMSLM